MEKPATKIRLDGLSQLDVLELQQLLPEAVHQEAREASDEHGEPLTTAVILLGVAALPVLAAWLVKIRSGDRFKRTVEVVQADGSVRKETIEYSRYASEPPKAAVLKQLGSMTHIDISQILADAVGDVDRGTR